jgi:hypothetical protein
VVDNVAELHAEFDRERVPVAVTDGDGVDDGLCELVRDAKPLDDVLGVAEAVFD